MIYSLSINRCPIHADFWAICLDWRTAKGDGHGTRLTPSKCCGRWETIKQFKVSAIDLRCMIEACENAIEDLGQAELTPKERT